MKCVYHQDKECVGSLDCGMDCFTENDGIFCIGIQGTGRKCFGNFENIGDIKIFNGVLLDEDKSLNLALQNPIINFLELEEDC